MEPDIKNIGKIKCVKRTDICPTVDRDVDLLQLVIERLSNVGFGLKCHGLGQIGCPIVSWVLKSYDTVAKKLHLKKKIRSYKKNFIKNL